LVVVVGKGVVWDEMMEGKVAEMIDSLKRKRKRMTTMTKTNLQHHHHCCTMIVMQPVPR